MKIKFVLLAILSIFVLGTGLFYWDFFRNLYSFDDAIEKFSERMTIKVDLPGELSTSFYSSKMKDQYESVEVEVISPAYGHLNIDAKNETKIQYRAFRFMDVIQNFLSKIPMDQRDQYQMIITCADGYQPKLDLSVLEKGTPYLAYEQVKTLPGTPTSQDGKWTLVDMAQGKGKPKYLSPAPFYLVWNTVDTYPTGWPFAVIRIEFVKK